MRGAPAGTPISLRGFRWHGDGEPGEGDIALTEAGTSAYRVEAATRRGGCDDPAHTHEPYTTWTLETIKLDPATLETEPDWILSWETRR